MDTNFSGWKDVVEETTRDLSKIGENTIFYYRIYGLLIVSLPTNHLDRKVFATHARKCKILCVPRLKKIFTFCLSREYVPKNWRRFKVVFIPKHGKDVMRNIFVLLHFHLCFLRRWKDSLTLE